MNRRRLPGVLTACAAVYVAIAVIGGVRSYTPVPFYDMWNGYLEFFVKATAGDFSVWWAQHNEHRIVLSRLLFWIDLTWFHGAGWFLLVVNYLLAAAAAFLFSAIVWERLPGDENRSTRRTAVALTVIVLTSWIQKENLVGGFQSQFFLAQLLPLLAFYCLHRAAFAASCATGIAALGAMANGFFALPLLAFQALWMKLPWRRIAVLAILTVLGPAIYFYGYQTPSNHGSLGKTLVTNPAGFVQYILLYLGGPIYYMTGKGSRLLAEFAGGFLILASAAAAHRAWRETPRSSQTSVLLAFLLYIGGSAVGTAGGRLAFGLDQALASRYQTPVLMAWAALFALYAPEVCRSAGWLLLVVPLLLAPAEIQALRSQRSIHFEQKVAALALELGIRDEKQVATIFPSAQWAVELSRIPAERNLSIFGDPDLRDVRKKIGAMATPRPPASCEGGLTKAEAVKEDPRYARIEGRLRYPSAQRQPRVVHVVNAAGTLAGHALLDGERFKGYVDLQGILPDRRLLFETPDPSCALESPDFAPAMPHVP